MRYALITLCISCLFCTSLCAQEKYPNTYSDTLRITLDQAEDLFLKKNAALLAQRFNIQNQQALVLQARLFKNPTIYYENNIFNPFSKKWFPTQKGDQGPNGDPATQGSFSWQIGQLITLAGKRAKNIALALTNVELAEYKYYDLLRNLKYQVRQNFVTMYYLDQTVKLYNKEISAIDKILTAYELQFEKKNIAEIDVERLKAFKLSLESEKRGYVYKVAATQNNLMILISTENTPYIAPQMDENNINKTSFNDLPYLTLSDSAYYHRYDLKLALTTLKYDRQFIALQKALAIPDINVGINFTENGNYIPNYYAANISFDLPIFDRNQGNIKAAQYALRSDSASYKATEIQVKKDIWQAATQLMESDKQYHKFDQHFVSNYERLMNGIIENFKKHNISIVEFIDYYDSFKSSALQFYQLQSDRLNDLETLNFTVGKTLYNY
jgi:outer membrane protein, heavy metal efflux system